MQSLGKGKENNYVIRIVGSPYKYNNLEGEGELMATIYFLMPGNTQREICTVYAGAHRYGTYARKLEVNWSAWGSSGEKITDAYINGLKLSQKIGRELFKYTYARKES